METLVAFKNSEQALEHFEANAPAKTHYQTVMEVDSQEHFDFCKQFKGDFAVIMQKSGSQKPYDEMIKKRFSSESFALLAQKFTEWYREHWLSKDEVHVTYLDLEWAKKCLSEAKEEGLETEKYEKMLKTVEEFGAGYYNQNDYDLILADKQTVTYFTDDVEHYQLVFEIDSDAYENESDE